MISKAVTNLIIVAICFQEFTCSITYKGNPEEQVGEPVATLRSIEQPASNNALTIDDFRSHAMDVGKRLTDLLQDEIKMLSRVSNIPISELDKMTVPTGLSSATEGVPTGQNVLNGGTNLNQRPVTTTIISTYTGVPASVGTQYPDTTYQQPQALSQLTLTPNEVYQQTENKIGALAPSVFGYPLNPFATSSPTVQNIDTATDYSYLTPAFNYLQQLSGSSNPTNSDVVSNQRPPVTFMPYPFQAAQPDQTQPSLTTNQSPSMPSVQSTSEQPWVSPNLQSEMPIAAEWKGPATISLPPTTHLPPYETPLPETPGTTNIYSTNQQNTQMAQPLAPSVPPAVLPYSMPSRKPLITYFPGHEMTQSSNYSPSQESNGIAQPLAPSAQPAVLPYNTPSRKPLVTYLPGYEMPQSPLPQTPVTTNTYSPNQESIQPLAPLQPPQQ